MTPQEEYLFSFLDAFFSFIFITACVLITIYTSCKFAPLPPPTGAVAFLRFYSLYLCPLLTFSKYSCSLSAFFKEFTKHLSGFSHPPPPPFLLYILLSSPFISLSLCLSRPFFIIEFSLLLISGFYYFYCAYIGFSLHHQFCSLSLCLSVAYLYLYLFLSFSLPLLSLSLSLSLALTVYLCLSVCISLFPTVSRSVR